MDLRALLLVNKISVFYTHSSMYILTGWVASYKWWSNIKAAVATIIHILVTVATLKFQFHHHKFSHRSNGARDYLGQATF